MRGNEAREKRIARRDGQFAQINEQVAELLAAGQPVISVDTTKKGLIGDFKTGGGEWRPKDRPGEVKVHDFVDKELGKAAPYGVYDVAHNIGWSMSASAMAPRSLRWTASGAGGSASGASAIPEPGSC